MVDSSGGERTAFGCSCTPQVFIRLLSLLVQKGDVVRWAVSMPEGPCDRTDLEFVTHTVNGRAILKMLQPDQVLEYGYVVETDAAAMTCRVRRLERVRGVLSHDNGVQQWQAKRSGRALYSLKELTWNQVLDYIDAGAVKGEIGLHVRFPMPAAILQTSAGPYWTNLTV